VIAEFKASLLGQQVWPVTSQRAEFGRPRP